MHSYYIHAETQMKIKLICAINCKKLSQCSSEALLNIDLLFMVLCLLAYLSFNS